MPDIGHQGDVLLVRSAGPLPKKLSTVPADPRLGSVLAYGEQTGHSHRFADGATLLLDPAEPGIVHVHLEGRRPSGHAPCRIIRKNEREVVVETDEGTIKFAASDVIVETDGVTVKGDWDLLVHEEHTAQAWLKGDYVYHPQREYADEGSRAVVD